MVPISMNASDNTMSNLTTNTLMALLHSVFDTYAPSVVGFKTVYIGRDRLWLRILGILLSIKHVCEESVIW